MMDILTVLLLTPSIEYIHLMIVNKMINEITCRLLFSLSAKVIVANYSQLLLYKKTFIHIKQQ
jgi:hypothetical protein